MTTAPERAQDYHADRTALSSSIVALLNLKTPAHAKAAYDGDAFQETKAMSLGTAVHQILLRDDRIAVIQAPDYRTNEAKRQRDAARDAGRVPLLEKDWYEAREIAQNVNGQILELRSTPTPFTKGTAEHVIRFEHDGVQCKAMLDWLSEDKTQIDDLKTTFDASPRAFSRHVFNMGYDIRAAFYEWAVETAYGVRPRFRWIAVETKPPYPVAVYAPTERVMASARIKVGQAVELWAECQARKEWPAYSPWLVDVDLPGWLVDASDRWSEVDIDEVPF